MKTRVTVKELNRIYPVILDLGSHSLLDGALDFAFGAKFYHAGGLGWNYNVFEIDRNTCVVSGYRTSNTLKAVKNISYSFCKPWNEKAKAIRDAEGLGYENYLRAKEEMQNLLTDFVKAVLDEERRTKK